MRLIDADRLKEYFDQTCTLGGFLGEAIQNIIKWAKQVVDCAPTESIWHPVSEMPKEGMKSYLVQTDTDYICECRWTNSNPIWTNVNTTWHWNIFDIPQYTKVVAWMEKPELYKEEIEK